MGFDAYREFMSQVSGSPPRAGSAPSSGFPGSPGEGADPVGMLMGALDLLQRPSRAVSEAYGEFTEGGSALAGALQGLKGDYEHDTLGEQLIPDKPGVSGPPAEEILKGAGRLGIDLLADPLIVLPFGPLKGPLVKGAGKVVGGVEKVASKVLQKVPGASAAWMGLLQRIMPTSSYLKEVSRVAKAKAVAVKAKFIPKDSAVKVAKGMDDIYEFSRVETSLAEHAKVQLTKQLGLNTKRAEPLRVQAHEWLQSEAFERGAVHSDQKVQAYAEFLRTKLDEVLGTVENYTDLNGVKFETTHPGLRNIQRSVFKRARKYKLLGKKNRELREEMWQSFLKGSEEFTHKGRGAAIVFRTMKKGLDKIKFNRMPGDPSIFKGRAFHTGPFQARTRYAPHMLNDKAMVEIADKGKGFSKMVEQFAEDNNMTHLEAQRILELMGGPARAGNIEYARQFKMDPEWMERDPMKWFPRYIERAYNRMAFGKVFGLDGKRLDRLLKRSINQESLNPEYAKGVRNIMMGRVPGDFMLGNIASKIMGAQVLMKMGPLSSLANLSQSSNTIIKDGATSFVKGILRSTTNEGKRAGVVAYQRGIHDMLMRIAGGTDALPAKYLEAIGFTPIERMNRMLGANTSITKMEDLIGTAGKWTDEIGRRGLREEELTMEVVERIKGGQGLPQELADRVGLLGADASQHATHYKDLPLWMQGPGARVMFQYKSFIYQQTRFLLREVMQPARKYFKSGGKEGSVAPLLRAGAVFGLGAESVNFLRQKTRQKAGELLGLDYEPEEFDEDHPLWQLFEHSMYVGGLGMAGDLVDRAAKRDLKGWILGPTYGDILDVAEGAVGVTKRASEEGITEAVNWDRLMVEVQRRIPFAGTLIPREPLFPVE